MTQVVSLSGGKDSCAIPLAMMERGEKPDLLLCSHVEWEFPEAQEACRQVSKLTGVQLVTLTPPSFDWWMLRRLVKKKDGTAMFGSGWPSRQHGRWCTREKFREFDKYMSTVHDPVKLVGFAADEEYRCHSPEMAKRTEKGEVFRFPLVEYGLTEEDALQLCYKHGITWDGLYEKFRTSKRTPRLSCWCCPHQPLGSLKVLRREFPHYWNRMLEMHNDSPQQVFKGWVKDNTDVTVADLEKRFTKEDKQRLLTSKTATKT